MTGIEVVTPGKMPHLPAGSESRQAVGVELEADSLEELFAEATLALCNCITEARDVMPRESRLVELAAPDADALLLAWLRELVAVFAGEGLLFSVARIKITSPGADGMTLEAQAWGEPFDPTRHAFRRSVDTIDPQALRIVRHEGRWRTRLSCSGPPVA
ncbi:MAG TPA: archease [Thermoanaerobaculia bacterium]|jgi:SHS2 domain-containing protein